jgi:hypothetical protein
VAMLQLLLLSLFFVPVPLIGVGSIVGYIFYALLVRRLQQQHNEVWACLGSPSAFPSWPPAGDDYWYGAVDDWIRRRDYLAIPDPRLVHLARITRISSITVYAGLACIALLVLVGFIIMLWGI